MQVKIFYNQSHHAMETEANKWLSDLGEKIIVQHTTLAANERGIVLAIWYSPTKRL
jgi:hypothetical protein